MQRAWKRVKANKGAAGVDGMDIAQIGRYPMTALPDIRNQLMEGTYRPSPVRRFGIPKSDGSERELGIPTVIDRRARDGGRNHAIVFRSKPYLERDR